VLDSPNIPAAPPHKRFPNRSPPAAHRFRDVRRDQDWRHRAVRTPPDLQDLRRSAGCRDRQSYSRWRTANDRTNVTEHAVAVSRSRGVPIGRIAHQEQVRQTPTTVRGVEFFTANTLAANSRGLLRKTLIFGDSDYRSEPARRWCRKRNTCGFKSRPQDCSAATVAATELFWEGLAGGRSHHSPQLWRLAAWRTSLGSDSHLADPGGRTHAGERRMVY
jgi:hypothetical protein